MIALFKIRKIDLENQEDEKMTPDYIVAKTQDYLMKEDLKNALLEFSKLEQSFKGGFDFAKNGMMMQNLNFQLMKLLLLL